MDQASSSQVAYPGGVDELKVDCCNFGNRCRADICARSKAERCEGEQGEAAQKVVKIISGDKVKTQTYCDIGKLDDQIDKAEQKKDLEKTDELNQKMEEFATKLGPEYVALIDEDIDPNSQMVRRSVRCSRGSTSCVRNSERC